MTSFFAAATLFFTGTGKRHTWTPLSTSSPPPDDERLKSDPGSWNCSKLRQDAPLGADHPGTPTAYTDRTSPSPPYVLPSDGSPQSTTGSPSSSDMNEASSPTPTVLSIDDATCFSPDCDHSYCSPPQLLYSPASCSSIALEFPLPPTSFSSTRSTSTDRLLLSPTGFVNQKPLTLLPVTNASKPGSTLAERRGLKGLALESAPTFSPIIAICSDTTTPTPTSSLTPRSRLLSPRTPDSASSFAQRLVGRMRSTTPTTASPDSPAGREYFEDPFGRAAPSFYDDAYFFDAAPARPHPDLFDLSRYSSPPAGAPRTVKLWPAARRMETQVFVDACDLLAPFPGSATPQIHSVSRAGPQVHSTARLNWPAPNTTPFSCPAPPPPPPSSATSLTSPALTLALSPSAGASPNLRPLLLPQKFARREIADAQSSSILQHATPKLRPLILPQELVRRATHPQRRARPRPLTFPSTLALSHRRALSTGTAYSPSTARMSTASTSTGASEAGTEELNEDRVGSAGRRREGRRQSQQLDEIICLLNHSGILEGLEEAGEHEPVGTEADAPPSDSDESSGLTTPSLVSRPGSSSSFSFISRAHGGDADDIAEKSRNLEDILELLDSQESDAICRTSAEAPAVEGEAEDSICAYAM